MSRHRNVRNLRLDDYVDDGYDDYDPHDEEEEEDDEQYQQYQYSRQQQHQQSEPAADGIDDRLLNDMVIQFRSFLNDMSLSTAQVNKAMHEADYDWEITIRTLQSQQEAHKEAPRCIDPSPIAKLLISEDDEISTSSSISPSTINEIRLQLQSIKDSKINHTKEAFLNPDYSSYVHEQGIVLTPPDLNDIGSVSPFQFDQPSPDDVVRAKQARGAGRNISTLRLPKPSAGRATVVKNIQQPGSKTAPIKPPRPASSSRASSLTPSVIKQRTKKIDLEKKLKTTTPSISVIVAGHVDAGKSTLVGHLMQQASSSKVTTNSNKRKNNNSKIQNLAWDTDNDRVERERGVTIDITSRLINRPGPPPRSISLIDAPGHRDFVPAMIVGAAQATAGLLVVDASIGEFESGFTESGQTREHAVVLKSFGITSLIVVVNKMDMVEFDQQRFAHIKKLMSDFLRSNGWKITKSKSQVSFLPVSARDGLNLSFGPKSNHPLCKWYSNNCLLKELDELSLQTEDNIRNFMMKPTRIIVTDFYRSSSLNGQVAISGRIISGSVIAKDKLIVVPGHAMVTVKAVNIESEQNSNAGTIAVAGIDNVSISLGLSDLPDGAIISSGSVLCDPENVAKSCIRIKARVLITAVDAIVMRGTRGVLHIGGASEEAYIAKLCEYVSGGKKRTTAMPLSDGKKKVPRRLVKGDSAIVEIACSRGVALEVTEMYKELGRFAFRQAGWTVAVGIVVQVMETESENDQGAENGKYP